MTETENFELLTKSSLELAREKLAAKEYEEASGVIRRLMGLLYENRRADDLNKHLSECFEMLGDSYRLNESYEAALSAYEEGLDLRTRDYGPTATETMAIIYKLERTLAAIAREARGPQRITASNMRWRANVLSGQFRAAQASDPEKKDSVPVPRLNSLWEETLRKNQEQVEQLEEMKRTTQAHKKPRQEDAPNADAEGLINGITHLMFQFAPVIILCLIVGIAFRSLPQISSSMQTAASGPDFKFLFAKPPETGTRSALQGIVSGTNKQYVSGDESQQLSFDEEHSGKLVTDGQAYTLPYLVDDGSAWSRLSLCIHTLMHQHNLWLVPNLYGLEDDRGNVYFDVGSSEYKLAKQMHEIAKQLSAGSDDTMDERLKDVKYDDPFNGKATDVTAVQLQASSVKDALGQLAPRVRSDDPGTVLCVTVDTGKQKRTVLCAVDRQRELIPFGNRNHTFLSVTGDDMEPPSSVDSKDFAGMIVLPVPSVLARHSGVLMTAVAAVLCLFGFLLFRKSAWGIGFVVVSGGFFVLTVIGLVNH